jgi:hypothetical protein
MGNKMRHVYGDPNPQPVNAQASTAVSIGDMVVLSSNSAVPASTVTNTTLAAVQESVHDAFIGVSADQRLVTDTTTLQYLVDTAGTFRFDCSALGNALDPGQLVGVDCSYASPTYTALTQQVIATSSAATSVGRLAKPASLGDTSVFVEIVTVQNSGVQEVA